MDHDRYLSTLRHDGAAMLAALRVAGPDAPVPDCPGWTAGDLAWHVTGVWSRWATIVAERATGPSAGPALAPRPTFPETVDLAEQWGRRLHDELATAGPATPVWTWGSDQSTAFVARRMAQETAVHRLDAERAAGRTYEIDAELAADGVDELLFELVPRVAEAAAAVGGSVHLHCTDVAGEWLVVEDDAGHPVVSRQHAKGDAALRGPANDLLLVLWRRLPLDAVEVIGDRGVAERFVARTRL
jgi:uncharacterized protein (TIGR03083 family)